MSDRHDHSEDEEKRIREATLDRTDEQSFPASDPPSTLPNPDDDTVLEDSEDESPVAQSNHR